MELPAAALIAAILTPFDQNGRVDLRALREHAALLVAEGIHALMPCGTTGEGPLLEEDEAAAVIAATVDSAAGRVPVLSHVGRPGTEATIRLGRRAVDAGSSGVSAVVPYYYSLGQDRVVAHYRAVVKALADVPVFAYTIPARAVNDLAPASLAELAGDGLAGLKDSTGSSQRHEEYLAVAREQAEAGHPLAVFVGSEGAFVDSVEHGSAGAVSALANLRPDLAVDMRRAYLDGDLGRARQLQEECRSTRAATMEEEGLPGLKRAVAERLRSKGIDYPPHVRAPLG